MALSIAGAGFASAATLPAAPYQHYGQQYGDPGKSSTDGYQKPDPAPAGYGDPGKGGYQKDPKSCEPVVLVWHSFNQKDHGKYSRQRDGKYAYQRHGKYFYQRHGKLTGYYAKSDRKCDPAPRYRHHQRDDKLTGYGDPGKSSTDGYQKPDPGKGSAGGYQQSDPYQSAIRA